jgi:two-component SAPR family response regulator
MAITGLALSSEVMAIRARGIPILRKPFTPDQLGRAIDALLTTSESAAPNKWEAA